MIAPTCARTARGQRRDLIDGLDARVEDQQVGAALRDRVGSRSRGAAGAAVSMSSTSCPAARSADDA